MWRFFLILSISLSVAYAENPCDILTGNQTFAPNPRGCDMFYYCGDNNIPKPGRCPTDPIIYHFNFETQSCELPENVDCTIDDELWKTDCPGIGIAKIPHQYSCSEYSGEDLLIFFWGLNIEIFGKFGWNTVIGAKIEV